MHMEYITRCCEPQAVTHIEMRETAGELMAAACISGTRTET